jgi:DNA polymerase I-like protein with 3'-5' exonuclease and polymerase domains
MVFDIKLAAWLLDPDKNKLSVDDVSKRFLKTISSDHVFEALYKTLN